MSAKKGLNLTLKIWRQKNNKSKGQFETYKISDVSTDSSFLEMLDMLNENMINEGKEPIAFDHDCREGICGMCSLYINGRAHGPDTGITTCQLHMRMFKDGETIHIEPWRSAAFPVIKDLVVDRSSFDRVMAAGGFISVNTSEIPWMPMRYRFQRKMRIKRWTLPHVSDVVPVWPPARTAQQCFL